MVVAPIRVQGAGLAAMAIAALLVALAPAPALAQEAAEFGSAGQWVLDGSFGFRMSAYDGGVYGETESYTFSLSPGVLWFAADGLAVGAAVHVERSLSPSTLPGVRFVDEAWGGALRLGHAHVLSPRVSLFPRYAFGWSRLSRELRADGEPPFGDERFRFVPLAASYRGGTDVWIASAFIPLLWHPVRHVFLGGGPLLAFDYSPGGDLLGREIAFTLGVCATIGGYLD